MGLFSFFKQKKEIKPNGEEQTPATAKIEIAFSDVAGTTTSSNDKANARNNALSMVSIGGYRSPSGGYMNYAEFLVSGYVLNEKTGRKNKFKETIYAKTMEEAKEKIQGHPIIDGLNIDVIPFEKATEKQLDYAHDLGAIVPDDAGKWDVSAIISRFTGALGDLYYDPPQESPSEEFALFADQMGCHFSKFIGEDDLFSSVICNLKDRDRDKVAFYAYCILKAHDGVDVATDPVYPDLTECYKFADTVIGSDSIMRSINERTPADYRHPHKGASSYKAVAEYFQL